MTTESFTAVCHVRAPLLLEPIDRQIETLKRCEGNGELSELLFRSWPQEVAVDDATPHQEVIQTYDRLSAWADQQGVSIEPPFRRRTTTSQITDTTTELLVTPLLCLEVYVDDELVGVFPHSADGETKTTTDAIATLRTGEVPRPLGEESPIAAVEQRMSIGGTSSSADGMTDTQTSSPEETDAKPPLGDCPACDDSLIDGQGLFMCPTCDWTGVISEEQEYVTHAPHEPDRYSLTQSL